MWGAKVGLCLPRSTRATSVARRPSTSPSASTTCQARWISAGFGENVRTGPLFGALDQRKSIPVPGAGAASGGLRSPSMIGLRDIQDAAQRVAGVVRATPADRSDALSRLAGRPIILKPEHRQR